ncbi:tetratricopeptide repeat protein [Histidinibacterium aquaticum]|uniref:Tetratricopeptide repeat protein n=1 Tax=Histidinibacterium aquaticum TaxID=2613962 RepID=A0A5J5GLQ1_9RHOB|nr:tetratricopeptide repeat protein [Histidinibacterium aquaticum]KAA9009286.1 tetratricopeptide repeat protein [Histidinibacterium aquaticum]
MSNNESFIDEVSEEVRRDRLYGYFRKYGWIALLVVLLIVGGTAWQQWSQSRSQAEAQARGDALLTALEANEAEARAEALAQVEPEGPAAAVTRFLTASAQVEAGETRAAVETLNALSTDGDVSPIYRDLASLKALMIDDSLDPAERASALEPLTAPGAPFRLVAQEQRALALIAAGETETALEALRSIIGDAEVTQGLRDRATSLIVALGGELGEAVEAPPIVQD